MKEITADALKEALKKDFNLLYEIHFTTNWKVDRLNRQLEINRMHLLNTLSLVNADARLLKNPCYMCRYRKETKRNYENVCLMEDDKCIREMEN